MENPDEYNYYYLVIVPCNKEHCLDSMNSRVLGVMMWTTLTNYGPVCYGF